MTRTNIHFMRSLSFCFCTLMCVLCVQATERSATEWVQAMNEAQAELSFEGTLSFWNGVDLTPIEYSQHVVDGKAHVKLKPLNGPEREITRTDEALSLTLSADDELRQVSNKLSGNSLSRLLVPNATKLSEIYNISKLPDKRIADRSAVGVSIMPKKPDRHGFKIWIDKDTALLLRMDMCDCDDAQKIKSVMQFTELTVLENSSEITTNADAEEDSDLSVNLVSDDQTVTATVQADWEPNFIPDGFVLSGTKTQEGALYNRTYSDGLNVFTIQTRPAPRNYNDDIQLETMVGPTIIVSRSSADARGRPHIVTVVGDLPRRTIWKIAEGVKFER